MKATILDLRRRMPEVLRALERNESVTIYHRGRQKAVLLPVGRAQTQVRRIREHAAFGMWADYPASADVAAYVRKLRQGRFGAL